MEQHASRKFLLKSGVCFCRHTRKTVWAIDTDMSGRTNCRWFKIRMTCDITKRWNINAAHSCKSQFECARGWWRSQKASWLMQKLRDNHTASWENIALIEKSMHKLVKFKILFFRNVHHEFMSQVSDCYQTVLHDSFKEFERRCVSEKRPKLWENKSCVLLCDCTKSLISTCWWIFDW